MSDDYWYEYLEEAEYLGVAVVDKAGDTTVYELYDIIEVDDELVARIGLCELTGRRPWISTLRSIPVMSFQVDTTAKLSEQLSGTVRAPYHPSLSTAMAEEHVIRAGDWIIVKDPKSGIERPRYVFELQFLPSCRYAGMFNEVARFDGHRVVLSVGIPRFYQTVIIPWSSVLRRATPFEIRLATIDAWDELLKYGPKANANLIEYDENRSVDLSPDCIAFDEFTLNGCTEQRVQLVPGQWEPDGSDVDREFWGPFEHYILRYIDEFGPTEEHWWRNHRDSLDIHGNLICVDTYVIVRRGEEEEFTGTVVEKDGRRLTVLRDSVPWKSVSLRYKYLRLRHQHNRDWYFNDARVVQDGLVSVDIDDVVLHWDQSEIY